MEIKHITTSETDQWIYGITLHDDVKVTDWSQIKYHTPYVSSHKDNEHIVFLKREVVNPSKEYLEAIKRWPLK
jgi:hypothetical protein